MPEDWGEGCGIDMDRIEKEELSGNIDQPLGSKHPQLKYRLGMSYFVEIVIAWSCTKANFMVGLNQKITEELDRRAVSSLQCRCR